MEVNIGRLGRRIFAQDGSGKVRYDVAGLSPASLNASTDFASQSR